MPTVMDQRGVWRPLSLSSVDVAREKAGGAIGVSGVSSQQDAQIAQAGVDALAQK